MRYGALEQRRSITITPNFGALFLNYGLAATAVLLAALSLVLLTTARAEERFGIALLLLGSVKLWAVTSIFVNTRQANSGDWNDKAVDYRYLAERLRAMLYLSRVGSFHPANQRPDTMERVSLLKVQSTGCSERSSVPYRRPTLGTKSRVRSETRWKSPSAQKSASMLVASNAGQPSLILNLRHLSRRFVRAGSINRPSTMNRIP